MRVPRALERANAGSRSLSVQAAGNGVRLGFEMLRLTARCCGEVQIRAKTAQETATAQQIMPVSHASDRIGESPSQ